MILWQSFWRNKSMVFFDLRRNCLPILFKWREFPLVHLALQLWPELQDSVVASSVGIHHVACGRYSECEVKLIKTLTSRPSSGMVRR